MSGASAGRLEKLADWICLQASSLTCLEVDFGRLLGLLFGTLMCGLGFLTTWRLDSFSGASVQRKKEPCRSFALYDLTSEAMQHYIYHILPVKAATNVHPGL